MPKDPMKNNVKLSTFELKNYAKNEEIPNRTQ